MTSNRPKPRSTPLRQTGSTFPGQALAEPRAAGRWAPEEADTSPKRRFGRIWSRSGVLRQESYNAAMSAELFEEMTAAVVFSPADAAALLD